MTRAEKIQTMETLWASLSQDDAEGEPPEWHETALKETEARLATGQEQVIDWSTAKRELRKRFE